MPLFLLAHTLAIVTTTKNTNIPSQTHSNNNVTLLLDLC